MKLLLEENLAPRLTASLSALYPGSVHLRDCGLRGATDVEVWEYPLVNGFAIVSKDSDFSQRSCSLLGSPPKVIWLRIGNCATTRIDLVLRHAAARMKAFEDSEESCLVLAYPRTG